MQQFILRTGPYAVSVLKNIHLLIICHHDHIDTYQKEIDNIFYNNQTIKFEIIAGDTVKSTPQDLLNVILQKTQPYLNEKNLHLLETKIAEESLPPLIIESVDPAETNTNNSIVPYTVGVAAIAALGAMQLPPGTKQLILQKAGETAGWTLEKGKNIGAATLQFGAEWGFFAAKKTGELLLNGATTTANYAKEYMNRK
jgi:hypothetical protein